MEVELPFAVIEPGAALIVEVAVEAAPALIVVAGLVLAVLEPSLMSVAVKVALPAVFGGDGEGLGAGDEGGVGGQGRVGVRAGDARRCR